MDPRELINRYAHEVGQHLPRQMRADVKTELQSLLEETLEARAADAARPPDEAMAVDVLREFGTPDEVARRYGPPDRYLIGPAYYPAFALVLRIVFTVVLGVFLLSLFFALHRSESIRADLGPALLQLVPQFLGYGLMNVGLVALIFTLLERSAGRRAAPPPAWDPRQLPVVQDPSRIDRGELIVGISIMTVMLLLFNFFPNWLSYFFVFDGNWGGVQLVAPGFSAHLPLLNISLMLEMALQLVLLREGRWQRSTRWWEFGSSVLSVVVLYRMITGAPLITIPFVDGLARVGLAILMVIGFIEACVQIYRLLSREPAAPALPLETKARSR